MGTPEPVRLFSMEGPPFKMLWSILLEMEASWNPPCGLWCCVVGWGGVACES